MAQTKTIEQDLITAMKKHDSLKVSTLRLILAALHNEQIAKKRPLSPQEEIQVLQKEVKKRQEAIALYQQGKRPELAAKETEEIGIIKEYLPAMMSREEINNLVVKMKAGGELDNDFGKAMKAVMAKTSGKAEGKMVMEAVKEAL